MAEQVVEQAAESVVGWAEFGVEVVAQSGSAGPDELVGLVGQLLELVAELLEELLMVVVEQSRG